MQVARIELENIAENALKNNFVLVKRLGKNLIKISCSGYSPRNTPKPMTFPRIINLDERFAEAIGMYIGDGKFMAKDNNHSEFVTVDKDMANFFWDFLREGLNININDISFTIRYKKGNKEKLKEKWSKILGVPKDKLLVQKRKKEMQDSITFQVNSKIFTLIFKKLIEIVLPFIKQNKKLRQALLRGEFASDGKLGVEKDTNTYYVSEVSFCYDMKKEVWLRDYIIECLKLEGINKFSFSNDGDIRITNWKNYIKFWEMNLFDRCERKKNKFISVIMQMFIYFDLNSNFLKKLLNSNHSTKVKLLKLLNLHRTNFKRVSNGNQLLKLEQINKLILLSNLNWQDVIDNTNRLRIGKLTYLNPQEDFIQFVINRKV